MLITVDSHCNWKVYFCIYAEQINLFKPAFGINDILRKKQNYCHTCHTRFAVYVFFPLLSSCVSSLLPKRSKKQPWASKMSELHALPPPPCKKVGIQLSFFLALLVTSDNSWTSQKWPPKMQKFKGLLQEDFRAFDPLPLEILPKNVFWN